MSDNKPVPADKYTKQLNMLSGLLRQLKLVWVLFLDNRVSLMAKSVLPLSLLYLVSPVDFVPDVFLGLGQLDDLGVIMLGISLFVRLCPPDLVEYYRHKLEFGDDTPDSETIDTTYRVIDEED